MSGYVVTYKSGRTRHVAMRGGRISHFKTKKSARIRAKEYEGYNPRVAKLKW